MVGTLHQSGDRDSASDGSWSAPSIIHTVPTSGPSTTRRTPPTNRFLPGSVVRRPVFSGFPIPHGVCLMVRSEQVWHERISWLQWSGLTVAAGSSSQPAKHGRFRRRWLRRRLLLLLLFDSGTKNNPQHRLVYRNPYRLPVVAQAAALNPPLPDTRLRAARRRLSVCNRTHSPRVRATDGRLTTCGHCHRSLSAPSAGHIPESPVASTDPGLFVISNSPNGKARSCANYKGLQTFSKPKPAKCLSRNLVLPDACSVKNRWACT
jgi:hypothetical protein